MHMRLMYRHKEGVGRSSKSGSGDNKQESVAGEFHGRKFAVAVYCRASIV